MLLVAQTAFIKPTVRPWDGEQVPLRVTEKWSCVSGELVTWGGGSSGGIHTF